MVHAPWTSHLFSLLFSIVVMSCGAAEIRSSSPTPVVIVETTGRDVVPSQPPVATEARDPAKNVQAGQVWQGRYRCAQGWTQAKLRIVTMDHHRVSAVFEFSHRNSGTQGAYHMHGIFDPSTQRLSLTPGDWIEQPPDYVSVALGGAIRSDGETYVGQMVHPSCGVFRLRRSTLD